MKKLLTLLLAATMLVSLAACNTKKKSDTTSTTAVTTEPEPPDDTPLYNENYKLDFSKYLTVPMLDALKLSEEDLNENWEAIALQICKSFTTYTTAEEGYQAVSGDKVNIHYKGYAANEADKISDATLQNMTNIAYDSDGNLLAGDDLVLGSGMMIGAYESEEHPEKNNAGFEDQLIGMTVGETRTITVTFPDNYGSDELNGKVIKFDVTVNKIQIGSVPELTDELVAQYTSNHYKTIAAYKIDALDYYKGLMAFDALDAAAVIRELPTDLVDKEITQYIYEYIEYLHPGEELTDEETKVIFDEQYNNAKSYAEGKVRDNLVLELLIERYGITLTWGEYKEMRKAYYEQDAYMYYQYYGITTEAEYEDFVGKEQLIQQFKYDKLLDILKVQAVFE